MRIPPPGPARFSASTRAFNARSASLVTTMSRGVLAASFAFACACTAGANTSDGPEDSGQSDTSDTSAPDTEATDTDTDGWTDGPDPDMATDDTGDDPQYGPDVIDYETCELDWGESADIVGETPQGPFVGKYAWFGWVTCNGEALSPTLVIAESAEDLALAVAQNPMGDAVPKRSMEWFLFGACSPAGGWVGEGKVQVYLRHDGPWDLGEGLIQISETHRIFDDVDPKDPPRMVGHVAVQYQEGWDIEGDFEAAYCGPLSYAINCD